jgi:hypothetical protein
MSDTPRTDAFYQCDFLNEREEDASFSRQLEREVTRLQDAILLTLEENAHLADGENCTLARLKRAMSTKDAQ